MTPLTRKALQDAFYVLSIRKTFTSAQALDATLDTVLRQVKAALEEVPDTRPDRMKNGDRPHAENYVGVYNRSLGYALTSDDEAGM